MPSVCCAIPGCPGDASTGRDGRCAQHARASQRAKANRQVYDSARWKRVREHYLFEHPLCEYIEADGTACRRIATVVHHRVELTAGGPAWSGLMGVCAAHHNRIHGARGRDTG
jgi:5-methylcytosine-specific restriction enzyme A